MSMNIIVNYTKTGIAISDFEIEKVIMNAYSSNEQLNVSTSNAMLMTKTLISLGKIDNNNVSFQYEGEGDIKVRKNGRYVGEIPDGFDYFMDDCLDTIVGLKNI